MVRQVQSYKNLVCKLRHLLGFHMNAASGKEILAVVCTKSLLMLLYGVITLPLCVSVSLYVCVCVCM